MIDSDPCKMRLVNWSYINKSYYHFRYISIVLTITLIKRNYWCSNNWYIFFDRLYKSRSIVLLFLSIIFLPTFAQYQNGFPMFYSKSTISPAIAQEISECRQQCGDKYYTCATSNCSQEACEVTCLNNFRFCYKGCQQQRLNTRNNFHANPDVNSFVIHHKKFNE